jgi:Tol biopolymer transport system component
MMAQSRASSTTPPSRNLKPPSQLEWLLVFYGFPQIGVPQSGIATITDAGLANVHDVTFLRTGGELSPDGRLIAYDNCAALQRGIYVAEPDGSNATRILPLSDSSCVDLRWSPDGTKLSYSSRRDFQLHVIDLASKQEEVLGRTDVAGWHSWSPAGDEIVYERGTGKTGRLLYVTDLHGSSRQITFARDFQPCEWEYNLIDTWAPAWSPKGDKIAFTQCGSLFVISPNGKDLRQLTSVRYTSQTSALPVAPAYSPRWSPDGRWIIFIGQVFVRSGQGEPLKRISADGNVVVDIGTLPYPGAPFSVGPLR